MLVLSQGVRRALPVKVQLSLVGNVHSISFDKARVFMGAVLNPMHCFPRYASEAPRSQLGIAANDSHILLCNCVVLL